MKKIKLKNIQTISAAIFTILFSANMAFSGMALAEQCGGSSNGNTPVTVSISFGCRGHGNPILDMTFAIIRFLSIGVGLVIVLSIIIGGLQYIGSQGNPENTNKAIERIRSALIALLVFIFAYAILNYVVPGQVLR